MSTRCTALCAAEKPSGYPRCLEPTEALTEAGKALPGASVQVRLTNGLNGETT